MTADLRKIVNFGHFTFSHISHPNEKIFIFQVSCGQLVVIFIILKAFSESRKNWSFIWLRTCEKKSILGISQFWIFLIPANEQMFTFQVSCGHLVVIFIILKDFPESRKKMKIFMIADLRKIVIFGHFTFLHISILKAFSESRKNWSSSWPQTCEKNVNLGISHFCIFLIQMSKYSHFNVLWWSGDDFHHFRRIYRK